MALPSKKSAWSTRLPWIAFLLLVGGGAFAYWRYVTLHPPPPITYKTVAVERRKIVGRVTASGTLQAVVTVQVGSQVSGRLQKINVDFNSQVKKGELLAKIDPQLFQANVAQAHANYVSAAASVVQAQANARNAERIYARTKALNEQNLAALADVETAETTLAVAKSGIDVAKASLEQAKAQLNQAEVNLSYTSIFSPIDGVVISRAVDVGQTVAASLQAPVLFTIAEDLRKMQVNTNVAEGDVGRLAPGMATYFTVDAFPGQRFNGKISQIRNAAQTLQNVVTYDAVVDVDNADLRLRPGMTANVTVIFDSRDQVLAVPNAALRFKPPPAMLGSASASAAAGAATPPPASGTAPATATTGRPPRGERSTDTRTVWVLEPGDHARSATLKLGLSDGTLTEVLSGDLKEGDLVVTDATTLGGAPAAAGGAASPVRGGRMF
jgi:HlyD family secretion protein